MRASSLSYNTIAVNREIDSAYDAVLEVRDNLTNIAIVAGLDIDTIIADLQDAKDFTGITVVVGEVASWDSSTKTITVPVVKGDTGDKGENGVDGVQGSVGETGPRGLQGIQGNKGDKGNIGPEGQKGLTGDTGPKGDTGISVHHSRATSTTNNEGNFSISGETDTYTIYGDADETVVLGEFSVSNGSSAYTYAVSAGYTGTSTQFYSELATIRIYSEQAQLNANSAAASESQVFVTAEQARIAASESSSSASSASASASIATTKAAEALSSANSASNSASTASTAAGSATVSAATASTKASEASANVTASASNASAALASKNAAAASEASALTYKNSAATSATTATTKASEASTSASAASTSATKAAASASSAASANVLLTTGTFTPTINSYFQDAPTYTFNLGTYTKINNLVFFEIHIKTATFVCSQGFSIRGLPFSRKSTINEESIFNIGLGGFYFTSGYSFYGRLISGQSEIYLGTNYSGKVAGGGSGEVTSINNIAEIYISGSYPV